MLRRGPVPGVRGAYRTRISISIKKVCGHFAPSRLVGSMGRVAAAGDNAAMQSFFALLQKNVLNRQSWTSRSQLHIAIITWIEGTYHRRRRQRVLGKQAPIEI